MMKNLKNPLLVIITLSVFGNNLGYGLEQQQPANLSTLFYTPRNEDAPNLSKSQIVNQDIELHHKQIDILVPQAYELSADGFLYNHINKTQLKVMRENQIKIMPMVTNHQFNPDVAHSILNNPAAQQRAIEALLKLCQQKKYYGIQLDFEHIPVLDKDAYSNFVVKLADRLHKIDCKFSLAIIPRSDDRPKSQRLLEYYMTWSGAYDHKVLAAASDFIVLMTYEQHNGTSTPGPIASYPWVLKSLKYSLRYIKPEKIYLGIPAQSNYWTVDKFTAVLGPGLLTDAGKTNEPYIVHSLEVSYAEIQALQNARHFKLHWDNNTKVNYAKFAYEDLNRFVFVSDADSTKYLYQMAMQNHLGGIAVYQLGDEDPRIWQVLKNSNK